MAARIVVTEFVSLDGVMEAPGGEPDFKYPGWSFEFERGDDGNQFKLDETRQADALLIGRRTYESFAGAWPQREGEFADKFNSMPKFVVSTTLKDPEWNNTTVLDSGDATAEVRKLKEEFDGELQVPGSHQARPGADRERPRRPDQPDGLSGDPRDGQEGLRGDARATQPAAQGIEGRRRRRRRVDLRAGRLTVEAGGEREYEAPEHRAHLPALADP